MLCLHEVYGIPVQKISRIMLVQKLMIAPFACWQPSVDKRQQIMVVSFHKHAFKKGDGHRPRQKLAWEGSLLLPTIQYVGFIPRGPWDEADSSTVTDYHPPQRNWFSCLVSMESINSMSFTSSKFLKSETEQVIFFCTSASLLIDVLRCLFPPTHFCFSDRMGLSSPAPLVLGALGRGCLVVP